MKGDYDQVWRWKSKLGHRYGQRCRVTARGALGTVRVEFEDGFFTFTSRWAVRTSGRSDGQSLGQVQTSLFDSAPSPSGRVPVVYASGGSPGWYVCAGCGRGAVRLWRLYQAFDPELRCTPCATERARASAEAAGYRWDPVVEHVARRPQGVVGPSETELFGWVPAVPDEEGFGYWGYGALPPAGIAWWRGLS